MSRSREASGSGAFSAVNGPDSGVPAAESTVYSDYRIGPLDELKITVFREPDLSLDEVPVDSSGSFLFPLIGSVKAAGKTVEEVAIDIGTRLNARYLRNAVVVVAVSKPVNFSVTVDGEVKKPGIFTMPGNISLLQAVALGEGTTEYARQSRVFIFRDIGGVPNVAHFDLRAIRNARAPNPPIKQGDVIVVGYSRFNRILRDVILSLPGAAGIFVALRR
jgi:polysaccharide biosynthesis/export protein